MDDLISRVVDISQYDLNGFCEGYTLRRHNHEAEANSGCYEARRDWIKYIGPVEQFGGCNPVNGNFTAVVLPLCKPERLRMVAYILEYAFLYDNIVELEPSENDDRSFWKQRKQYRISPELGRKQIQAKMMMHLAAVDRDCTRRVERVWKEMIKTTLRQKDTAFHSLEEYVEFRIIDTGAPFVEAMMLWGMGETLTEEEDQLLKPIVQPCYAALGLANDYFSFDREFEEMKESGADSLTNIVWLYMRWHNVDVETAKKMAKEATMGYEQEFLKRCEAFRSSRDDNSDKLDRYLRALAYQIPGNVVWSLNCPRYHPDHRYDANAGLEDQLMRNHRRDSGTGDSEAQSDQNITEMQQYSYALPSHRTSESESSNITFETTDDSSVDENRSTTSSMTSHSTIDDVDSPPYSGSLEARLDSKLVRDPYEYIISLPSKGVRENFMDALNLWLGVEESQMHIIKKIVGKLHSASLMLDDIEDGSLLRRGEPAAHAVFGTAQTINSANFAMVEAIQEAISLDSPLASKIVLEELLELHIGQSHDLHWTRHSSCPTEDAYLQMVDKKTGGLFRLLCRLMLAHSTHADFGTDIEELVSIVGVQFQIRDDYQNLKSSQYADQKGFCEDLDEGKISFPLVHALKQKSPHTNLLKELLRQGKETGGMSKEQKLRTIEQLERCGSLEYTVATLRRLEKETVAAIAKLERRSGLENWLLRALVQKLCV